MRDLVNPIIKSGPKTDDLVHLAECITLRDLLAAAALIGQEANPNVDLNYDHTAEAAYKTADAMLVERAKR